MGTILRFASVPLRKMGTDLLASRGSKGKNGNSLACLRNAGSHSAESYCMYVYGAQRRVVGQRRPQLEQTLNRKSRADHLRYLYLRLPVAILAIEGVACRAQAP